MNILNNTDNNKNNFIKKYVEDIFIAIWQKWRVHKYFNWKEKNEIRFILNNVIREWSVVFDIWWYKGETTHHFSRTVWETWKVITIEPQKDLCVFLEKIYSKSSNIIIQNLALSNNDGDFLLKTPIKERKIFQWKWKALWTLENRDRENYETQTVNVTTLDKLFKTLNINQIDLIKCDVEWHEDKVFLWAQETIKKYHPAIMFECERNHRKDKTTKNVFDILHGFWYEIYFFDKWWNQHLIEDFNEEKDQDNINNKDYYVNNFIAIYKS